MQNPLSETGSRPGYFKSHNGERQPLPFSPQEYETRLSALRRCMEEHSVSAVLLTSMQNIAYYSGFLYCSFGRQYGCVVSADTCTTITASIDSGQPWRRSHCDNLIYTDWSRGNFWLAVKHVIGAAQRIAIEGDHMTLVQQNAMLGILEPESVQDLSDTIMSLRMVKSDEEIALIKLGASIADMGGEAIREAIRPGVREIDIAMAGRDEMELAIAKSCPQSELRDTWAWFQSGINTDGAHNPVTTRTIKHGDILSLNTFPMISGYYTALERTLFMGEVDADSLAIWQANVAAHELGISLIHPGVRCSEICEQINQHLDNLDLLQYRTFGYGHSFGLLSHYYGREGRLELREDIDTILVPGMVVSMEPMLTLPEGMPGAGGYREHDILVVTEDGAENITRFPYGPERNVIE